MKQILIFLKKKDLYLGIVRYLLGLVMIHYAITKILKTQFVILPFDLWQQPLEHMSGKYLAWAFLGYSTWFEVLLGFFELIPALLLLFRRTALTGAILLLPVTLNVYLINMALNLWQNTKVISLILLILNIIILLFEWRRIWDAALIIIGKVKWRFTLMEFGINFIIVAVLGYFTIGAINDYIKQKSFLTGDWLNRHPNEWVLTSEKLGNSTLKPGVLKAYFGPYGHYSELDSGNKVSTILYYHLNEKKKTINFYTAGTKEIFIKSTYQLKGDTLRINKITDSTKNTVLTQVYIRRVINEDTE